jgi:hypothetical protein
VCKSDRLMKKWFYLKLYVILCFFVCFCIS